jgi:methylenetetrahydrofolate dehydrogenase (NADP+) / methenyltetrahydrofolate cyclohydrolase
MANILYGAPVREKIKAELIERIKKLGRSPVLAIVQVGDREDSNVYIKQKQKFGQEIGAKTKYLKIEKKEKEIIDKIKELNEDERVDGIIIQLPLPNGVNTEKVLNEIKKEKDADGLAKESMVIPATARGVMAMLDYYGIELKGNRAAVIGQSILAGKPISDELERRGAVVFRCDITTPDIPVITRECDILISAAGKAGLITKNYINEKQVVVDVGINKNDEGKLAGDVYFEEVQPLVVGISPVPGGVGPLTVACLFQNLLDLTECRHKM